MEIHSHDDNRSSAVSMGVIGVALRLILKFLNQHNADLFSASLEVSMEYANDYSGYGNEVLYRMCSERPLHDDIDTITSKFRIIGRAYSAAIERGAGNEFKIETAAALIKNSEIDAHISKLKNIDRPTHENLGILLTAHKYLTDVLKSSTGIEKRSLVSKYLHFHAPRAVFIYDSIANNKVRKILASSNQRFKPQREHDHEYEAFVLRCIYFRDVIYENEIGAMASPRKIDMRLLDYGIR